MNWKLDNPMKRELTENEIHKAITALEKQGEKGDLTPSDARRLAELRSDLKEIHRAKWPHAYIS